MRIKTSDRLKEGVSDCDFRLSSPFDHNYLRGEQKPSAEPLKSFANGS